MEKFPSSFGMFIRLVIVVTVALYVFFKFSFEIFDIHFDKRDLSYNLLFEHATGVEKNTQVELSGFKIGHVVKIEHIKKDGKTFAKVKIVVNKKYQDVLTDKAYFFIARRKFIGLTFIKVIPEFSGNILKHGETIKGVSPPRYSLLFSRSKELLVQINKFLHKSHLNELLSEYAVFMKESKEIKKHIVKKLPSIKKNIKILVKELKFLKKFYDNNSYIVSESKNMLQTANDLLKNERFLNIMDKSDALFDKTLEVKDDFINEVDKNRLKVKRLITSAKKILSNIEDLDNKIKELKDVFDIGLGNVGLFLNDKEIYDYSRFIMKIIKQESYRYLFPIKHGY